VSGAVTEKIDVDKAGWDRLFAPSSCLAVITTVDADGQVNAAPYGTCTRVCHDPVYIAFTVGLGKDTSRNVLETGEFTVNLPSVDADQLRWVVAMGATLPPEVNELELAGLTAVPGKAVRPPRIAEFGRHFECQVAWTKGWETRLMVVGAVVAASCDPGIIDEAGFLNWDVARPAHFCGSSYVDETSHCFVSAYEVTKAPNSGPPALSTLASRQAAARATGTHG
jgi:flavin reductase (DIM6/NTAB) family NADH-FMN oxidoreductase RutF